VTLDPPAPEALPGERVRAERIERLGPLPRRAQAAPTPLAVPGARQGALEVHLLLRTATGPFGPIPVALPFEEPRWVWYAPSATPSAPAPREFSLSELLNGRADERME
jgi:hypothetical protein